MQNARTLKHRYQDRAIAHSYDCERFSSMSGRIFNALQLRAVAKAARRAQRQFATCRTLDMCCGTGRITEELLKLGLCVTGGDVSEEMIQVAEKRCERFGNQVAFEKMDLDQLALPDNTYDLVVCVKLLHHFAHPVRARILRELARVSRAYLLVSMSYSSPFYQVRRAVKRLLHSGVPKNATTPHELHDEAESAGVIIIRKYWTCPVLSEDLLVLLQKPPVDVP